jgi:hypothetical protein
MRRILSEVLASNRHYAANFGDKSRPSFPAWMPGSTLPNMRAYPKGGRARGPQCGGGGMDSAATRFAGRLFVEKSARRDTM